MIWLELLLFAAVTITGVVGYRVGHHDGYKRGWFDGHQHATNKFLPLSHVQPYDHVKEGL